MSKLNTAEVSLGAILIHKSDDTGKVTQRCPYNDKVCGLHCPKCYITKSKVVEMPSQKEREDLTLHTCGGDYEVEKVN